MECRVDTEEEIKICKHLDTRPGEVFIEHWCKITKVLVNPFNQCIVDEKDLYLHEYKIFERKYPKRKSNNNKETENHG